MVANDLQTVVKSLQDVVIKLGEIVKGVKGSRFSPTPGGQTLTFAPITLSGMKQASSPAPTTSTAPVMMGLALTLLSEVATRVFVTIDGTVSNSTNNGVTYLTLCYGTGAPPANGAALTGAVASQEMAYQAGSGGSVGPFSLTAMVSGMAPQTPYWFDLAVRVSAGSGTVTNVDASAVALP